MTQLQINAADYGLEENKAKQISDMFKPMLDKMTELEVQYNEVIKRPMELETIQMAHDLRLAYVKVRTGTAAIHKELKAFYLQGGRFVDGWKNAQIMASQGIEDKLKSIEDHFVNIENVRIEKLQEERAIKLHEFDVEFIPDQLGEMDSSVWTNYISGVKLNYEAQKAAEKKAEEDRIAKKKAEAAEHKRINLENIRLNKEAEEREKSEQIRIKKEQAEQKTREEREQKEKAAREKKEADDLARHEAELKKERDAKAKIEAELKAKAEAEQKASEEEKAKVQAELNMGDEAKVRALSIDLDHLKVKYAFKSQKNKKMYSDVGLLIDKVINHINQ